MTGGQVQSALALIAQAAGKNGFLCRVTLSNGEAFTGAVHAEDAPGITKITMAGRDEFPVAVLTSSIISIEIAFL